jgi:hypothetical protein
MAVLGASMGIMAGPARRADNRYMEVVVKKAFIGQYTFSPVAGIAEIILIRTFCPVSFGEIFLQDISKRRAMGTLWAGSGIVIMAVCAFNKT